MTRNGSLDPEYDETYAQAAAWFARLHDAEISVAETMEWQRLMALDSQFAVAYARIEEVWNVSGDLGAPPLTRIDAEKRDRYDGSVPVSQWLHERQAERWPSRRPVLLAAAVAGIAIAAGYWMLSGRNTAAQIVQTPAGQNRAFILADGSRLNLGADTRLEIRLDATSRRINLTRGEAFFAVAKDRHRPFSVHSGNATVTAVGTEFSVNRGAGQTVVAVIEGRVEIALGAARSGGIAATAKTRELTTGEQILVSTAGPAGGDLSNVVVAIGRQDGQLAFQSEPLSRVLEDVNRYAPKPILVDDPSIGDLMVTGTVVRDNINGWLSSLEKVFPVRVVEEPQRVIIRSRY